MRATPPPRQPRSIRRSSRAISRSRQRRKRCGSDCCKARDPEPIAEMLLELASVLAVAALAALIVQPALGIPLLFLVRPIVDATWAQHVFFGLNLLDVFVTLVPVIAIAHG